MFPCACDTVLLSFVCSRSVCLDSAQTSTETGTTTGRRTIWLELSDTQESMMEIMNIMSPSCWQTSTKSECLKADDTKPICAVGWPPIEPRQSFIAHFPFESRRKKVYIVISKDILTWTLLISPVFCSSLELPSLLLTNQPTLWTINETEATLPLVSESVIPTQTCLGVNRQEDKRRCLVNKHAIHKKL